MRGKHDSHASAMIMFSRKEVPLAFLQNTPKHTHHQEGPRTKFSKPVQVVTRPHIKHNCSSAYLWPIKTTFFSKTLENVVDLCHAFQSGKSNEQFNSDVHLAI